MKNKIYKLKIRTVDEGIFEAIKNGTKKVETRAATESYRKIKKGDRITFICGSKKTGKEVVQAVLYKSIASLFKHYAVRDIFPSLTTIGEARKVYYSFPDYREKIKKFGLIAWELK